MCSRVLLLSFSPVTPSVPPPPPTPPSGPSFHPLSLSHTRKCECSGTDSLNCFLGFALAPMQLYGCRPLNERRQARALALHFWRPPSSRSTLDFSADSVQQLLSSATSLCVDHCFECIVCRPLQLSNRMLSSSHVAPIAAKTLPRNTLAHLK